MKYYEDLTEIFSKNNNELKSYELLTEANGCVSGCRAGTSYYCDTEYNKPGVHEDQEGFLVLKGNGMAKIGDEEFSIRPGTSFIAPAHTPHSIKRNSDSEPVLVFWFHSAV